MTNFLLIVIYIYICILKIYHVIYKLIIFNLLIILRTIFLNILIELTLRSNKICDLTCANLNKLAS